MNNISKAFAAAALTTLSMTAGAWWGGPWGDHGYGDGFGDGYVDGGFSFGMGARAGGHGRGHGYDYYGYPYHGYPYAAVPMVLSEEQQKAFEEQRRAFEAQQKELAAQQARVFQEAMEAQRKHAQQYAAQPGRLQGPFSAEQAPFEYPFERETGDFSSSPEQVIEQMEARRAKIESMRPAREPMATDPQREAFRKQMRARREALRSRDPGAAVNDARREEMRQQMEQRHAEMMERVEAQRKRAQEQHATLRRPVEVRRPVPET